MSATAFECLMTVALGALAGTGIGLVIGFAAKKQKFEWSAMTPQEKSINIALVIVFLTICIAGLAWYVLV